MAGNIDRNLNFTQSGPRFRTVTIPNTVTRIGEDAFHGNLLSDPGTQGRLTIPDNVSYIGRGAFLGNDINQPSVAHGTRVNEHAFGWGRRVNVRPSAAQIAQQQAQQARQQAAEAERERARQEEQNRLARLYNQAGNNLGGLANTSWVHQYRNIFGSQFFRIDFGNGNFLHTGSEISRQTGTFRVSGDTVIMRRSDGQFSQQRRVGNSLDRGGIVFFHSGTQQAGQPQQQQTQASNRVPCVNCNATGTRPCNTCNGTGRLWRPPQGVFQGGWDNCRTCRGNGRVQCTTCRGAGTRPRG